MTRLNRGHSRIEANIAHLLRAWSLGQPAPRGEVLVGGAGVRPGRDPDTTVGIDVGYLSAELAAAGGDDDGLVNGVPTLIVEILSPSDRQQDVHDKLDAYRACGVPLIWVVDTRHRTITVHRPDAEPALFNVTHTLDATRICPASP